MMCERAYIFNVPHYCQIFCINILIALYYLFETYPNLFISIYLSIYLSIYQHTHIDLYGFFLKQSILFYVNCFENNNLSSVNIFSVTLL